MDDHAYGRSWLAWAGQPDERLCDQPHPVDGSTITLYWSGYLGRYVTIPDDDRPPRRPRPVGPCGCECCHGGFCGGCGHAGCGGRR